MFKQYLKKKVYALYMHTYVCILDAQRTHRLATRGRLLFKNKLNAYLIGYFGSLTFISHHNAGRKRHQT